MIAVLSMAFIAGLVKVVIFLKNKALKRKETLRLVEAKRELELRCKIEAEISGANQLNTSVKAGSAEPKMVEEIMKATGYTEKLNYP